MQSESLSQEPKRTHPATVLLGLGSVGFAALMAVVIPGGGIVFELLLALFGLRQIAQWYFRTYELRADDLVIREGIITRREQIVPYNRVQQVDIHRGVLAQVLGLSELQIETAGSAAGRVQLRLLDQATAASIRTQVLSRRAAGASAGQPPPAVDPSAPPWAAPAPEATPVLVVPTARLALAGATATWLVFTGCAATLLVAGFVPIALLSSAVEPLAVVGIAFGAVALVALLTGLSLVLTVVQYAGLTVSVTEDDLRVDYGALEKQHLSVPRRRVQQVSISDNPLRRALRIVDVTLHSAAAPGSERAGHLTVIAFPREEVGPFLAFLMQDPEWHAPELQPRTRAAHRRAIVRRMALLCVPAVVAAVGFFPEGLLSVVVAIGAGYVWGAVAHRRAGHAITDAITVFAAGAIAHRVHVVPRGRVQSARTTASPFQRRAGLATSWLDIAGSPAPNLYDIAAATASDIRTRIPRSAVMRGDGSGEPSRARPPLRPTQAGRS
jgi:putative membrane protein